MPFSVRFDVVGSTLPFSPWLVWGLRPAAGKGSCLWWAGENGI